MAGYLGVADGGPTLEDCLLEPSDAGERAVARARRGRARGARGGCRRDGRPGAGCGRPAAAGPAGRGAPVTDAVKVWWSCADPGQPPRPA
ncbi:hypothetical protein GCM10010240_28110 [Streptomyces griseoviridis]|nr:hypothetical protein GCM10010240_28110 [Streptomyces griseoviridis]